MLQPTLEMSACRERQRRLLSAVEGHGVDWIILSRIESVQWLTGWRGAPVFSPLAAMNSAGHVLIVMPESAVNAEVAADDRVLYRAAKHSTLCEDQRAESASVLVSKIGGSFKRIACEFSAFDNHLDRGFNADLVDVTPLLCKLRRYKHPDELNMIANAIRANRAMYTYARKAVRPGISELELFAELHQVAVTELGEPLTYFGQDFQCNSLGGPPRNRRAVVGELYILDLGVGYRGYYSDNSRTLAVGNHPTAMQVQACEKVLQVFEIATQRIRPGVKCKLFYDEIHNMLNQHVPLVFGHHLGHGIGLAAHEGPHLNPNWDDAFEEGDVFVLEPGLYHPDLRSGLRLEQAYRVTNVGIELLSDWPLTL
jgi:Xaa-Pro dipeptidase